MVYYFINRDHLIIFEFKLNTHHTLFNLKLIILLFIAKNTFCILKRELKNVRYRVFKNIISKIILKLLILKSKNKLYKC